MTDAVNAPVRRAPPEYSNEDTKITQHPIITDREDLDNVVVAERPLEQDYAAAIAFLEEPVTILISRPPVVGDEKPPTVVDIWCNGRGAEVLINGRFVPTGAIPIGFPVTTKRKYVEILARSKINNVRTISEKIDQNSERNDIEITTSSKMVFTVVEDKSPKGREWLARIMSPNF